MSIRNIADVESLLQGSPSVRDLYSIWASKDIRWLDDVSLAHRFTSLALEKEEFLLVLDAARQILRTWPTANPEDLTNLVRVRMNKAAALMRLGFMRDARLELESCVAPGFQPELGRKLKADILLQLGHILREEWTTATDRAPQIKNGEDALSFYRKALEVDPERLEALVMTASTAFILGDAGNDLRAQSQHTARRVLKLTSDLRDTEGPRWRTTWAEATAHAVLGECQEAARSFEQLKGMHGATTAHLAEARFQAQFLAQALDKPRDFFKPAFPPLQLVVFSGHLPDRPGGRRRFPPESIPQVLDALRSRLKSMQARVGLASASAGADLLFAQALREVPGSTLHLVLPWSQDEFRRTSVHPYEPPGGPPMWEPLFEQAIESAATAREIGQVYEPSGDVGWEFMMEVTGGIALYTARALRLDIQPMVLWDGHAGRGTGGTASFHDLWTRRLKIDTIVIPLPAATLPAEPADGAHRTRACERSILHQEVKSMLFADIVGYSKLTEKAIPEFIGAFLERLGRLTSTSKHTPISVNTWGDAIYAVFDFARDAGQFALELAEMVREGEPDWLAKGLYWETRSDKGELVKHPLNIRIGLHTGPVVMHYDPVVRRLGFTGAHVNRAARIEPVTEHGQVFASEEFAAMAELNVELQRHTAGAPNSGLGFVCEYAGSMQLAKGYPGLYRIYRVVRKRVFALEALAITVHEAYCAEARARGDSPATNTSMRHWSELSEDLREANRAQVADIPNKLRSLGLELAPSDGRRPSEITITDKQVEELALREHDRWMAERAQQGWTYAPQRDNLRKHHPLIVPADQLSEVEKEKDRDTIRNLPKLIEKAGFRVRRIN